MSKNEIQSKSESSASHAPKGALSSLIEAKIELLIENYAENGQTELIAELSNIGSFSLDPSNFSQIDDGIGRESPDRSIKPEIRLERLSEPVERSGANLGLFQSIDAVLSLNQTPLTLIYSELVQKEETESKNQQEKNVKNSSKNEEKSQQKWTFWEFKSQSDEIDLSSQITFIEFFSLKQKSDNKGLLETLEKIILPELEDNKYPSPLNQSDPNPLKLTPTLIEEKIKIFESIKQKVQSSQIQLLTQFLNGVMFTSLKFLPYPSPKMHKLLLMSMMYKIGDSYCVNLIEQEKYLQLQGYLKDYLFKEENRSKKIEDFFLDVWKRFADEYQRATNPSEEQIISLIGLKKYVEKCENGGSGTLEKWFEMDFRAIQAVLLDSMKFIRISKGQEMYQISDKSHIYTIIELLTQKTSIFSAMKFLFTLAIYDLRLPTTINQIEKIADLEKLRVIFKVFESKNSAVINPIFDEKTADEINNRPDDSLNNFNLKFVRFELMFGNRRENQDAFLMSRFGVTEVERKAPRRRGGREVRDQPQKIRNQSKKGKKQLQLQKQLNQLDGQGGMRREDSGRLRNIEKDITMNLGYQIHDSGFSFKEGEEGAGVYPSESSGFSPEENKAPLVSQQNFAEVVDKNYTDGLAQVREAPLELQGGQAGYSINQYLQDINPGSMSSRRVSAIQPSPQGSQIARVLSQGPLQQSQTGFLSPREQERLGGEQEYYVMQRRKTAILEDQMHREMEQNKRRTEQQMMEKEYDQRQRQKKEKLDDLVKREMERIKHFGSAPVNQMDAGVVGGDGSEVLVGGNGLNQNQNLKHFERARSSAIVVGSKFEAPGAQMARNSAILETNPSLSIASGFEQQSGKGQNQSVMHSYQQNINKFLTYQNNEPQPAGVFYPNQQQDPQNNQAYPVEGPQSQSQSQYQQQQQQQILQNSAPLHYQPNPSSAYQSQQPILQQQDQMMETDEHAYVNQISKPGIAIKPQTANPHLQQRDHLETTIIGAGPEEDDLVKVLQNTSIHIANLAKSEILRAKQYQKNKKRRVKRLSSIVKGSSKNGPPVVPIISEKANKTMANFRTDVPKITERDEESEVSGSVRIEVTPMKEQGPQNQAFDPQVQGFGVVSPQEMNTVIEIAEGQIGLQSHPREPNNQYEQPGVQGFDQNLVEQQTHQNTQNTFEFEFLEENPEDASQINPEQQLLNEFKQIEDGLANVQILDAPQIQTVEGPQPQFNQFQQEQYGQVVQQGYPSEQFDGNQVQLAQNLPQQHIQQPSQLVEPNLPVQNYNQPPQQYQSQPSHQQQQFSLNGVDFAPPAPQPPQNQPQQQIEAELLPQNQIHPQDLLQTQVLHQNPPPPPPAQSAAEPIHQDFQQPQLAPQPPQQELETFEKMRNDFDAPQTGMTTNEPNGELSEIKNITNIGTIELQAQAEEPDLWDSKSFAQSMQAFMGSMENNSQLISFCLKPLKKGDGKQDFGGKDFGTKTTSGRWNMLGRSKFKQGGTAGKSRAGNLRQNNKSQFDNFGLFTQKTGSFHGSSNQGKFIGGSGNLKAKWNLNKMNFSKNNTSEQITPTRANAGQSKLLDHPKYDNNTSYVYQNINLNQSKLLGDSNTLFSQNLRNKAKTPNLTSFKEKTKKFNSSNFNSKFLTSPDPSKTYLKPSFNISNPTFGDKTSGYAGRDDYKSKLGGSKLGMGNKIFRSGFGGGAGYKKYGGSGQGGLGKYLTGISSKRYGGGKY